ncbi:hypothetical protein SND92_00060, partial [Escherichia coli]|nr:hypothetical protein [Escherichia coli]
MCIYLNLMILIKIIRGFISAKSISTIAESKRFPLHEMRDDVAFQIINDELYLDGNARQNLATFCQTWDDE